jgi:hypothetical protein
MKGSLMFFASLVLGALIGVSFWATSRMDLLPAVRELFGHASKDANPWFIATLFDAYFGFLWFWLWVAYKESGFLARFVWLVLILTLGNIAMASYVLLQLGRLPEGADIEDLLLRRWA